MPKAAMTGAEIAEAIAKTSNGVVRMLPTGEDREYAVVIQNIAIVLVREFRSSSIGVSVLAMRAWNISGNEDPTKVIRESAHLAHEWISAHPDGVTALDVALEAAPKIEKAIGAPCILQTPGGQPAPSEMWLGDIGIFQQEDTVRVDGCRVLKTRAQLAGVTEKMVKKANIGQSWADQIKLITPQLDEMAKSIASTLNREAPPPNAQWSSRREHDDEFHVECGPYGQKRVAAKITWKKSTFGCVAGLKGERGLEIAQNFDLAHDLPRIVNAVRVQLSVLTPADIKIGDRFLVVQAFEDDHHVKISAGELLKYIARVEEDHQPDAATFERESLPGRQRIDITDIWPVGSALDKHLKRL